MKLGTKRNVLIGLLILVVVAAGAVFLALRVYGAHLENVPTALEIMALVKMKYVDPVSITDLARAYTKDGTIAGMLELLEDPYTRYMNKSDFAAFEESTEGSFAGIGVSVDIKDDYVVVVQPYKGTPGYRAGLKPGDLITAVDGKSTKNMALDAAVSMIRGPAGTTVVLTVERETDGQKQVLEFRITRAIIHIPTVEYKVIKDSSSKGPIGYLYISQFTRGTSNEVMEALNEMKAEGIKGLLMDLRFNPGGLLDEVVNICAQFMQRQPVLYVVERDQKRQPIFAKSYQPLGLPMVVLVNEWSASASEIAAGAMKDLKIATIVGKTTFGKGVVQTIYPLTSGGGMTLTTSRYLTAGGNSIHKIGIKPDVEVDLPEDSTEDVQYNAALKLLREKIK
ncbi:MAG: S41 family peptidase [Bacillota bacterium]